jgi:hypothetical protein
MHSTLSFPPPSSHFQQSLLVAYHSTVTRPFLNMIEIESCIYVPEEPPFVDRQHYHIQDST